MSRNDEEEELSARQLGTQVGREKERRMQRADLMRLLVKVRTESKQWIKRMGSRSVGITSCKSMRVRSTFGHQRMKLRLLLSRTKRDTPPNTRPTLEYYQGRFFLTLSQIDTESIWLRVKFFSIG